MSPELEQASVEMNNCLWLTVISVYRVYWGFFVKKTLELEGEASSRLNGSKRLNYRSLKTSTDYLLTDWFLKVRRWIRTQLIAIYCSVVIFRIHQSLQNQVRKCLVLFQAI